jgi:hypothetical protein
MGYSVCNRGGAKMKILISAVTALVLMASGPVMADEGVTPMLNMDTTYTFVFPSEFIAAAPFAERAGISYALVWEGTIQGDVEGVIRWWVEFTGAGFTAMGRFEVWDCVPEYPISCDYDDAGLLVMAGYETFRYVSEVDWEGKGIVTYANEEYAEWYGRRYTDGGYVEFEDGLPSQGEGWFTIYDRPSNKH